MKLRIALLAVVTASSLLSASGQAVQRAEITPPAASAPTLIPALVPFSGVATGLDGKALTGELGISFMIFKNEQGGEPLWVENQSVIADATGGYKVHLGAAYPTGLPAELFSTGEARWLQIQIAGAAPQSRILLSSVPYAMKAADAATLGGLPASAFALVGSKSGVFPVVPATVTPDGIAGVTTTGGSVNNLAKFSGSNTIVNSILYDNGSRVGVGTTNPNSTLSVSGSFAVNGGSTLNGMTEFPAAGTATASTGYNSQQLDFFASAYNSSSRVVVQPHFAWQAEPASNNTASPTATLKLLASNTQAAPTETGFYFNENGTMHFSAAQTFPGTGTGTITGVTAGSGLSGGGTSGKVTLSVNAGEIPTLSGNNALSGNNNFTGSNTFVASINENLDINLDNTNQNNGNVSPGLRFGNASGEAISSQRTTNGTTATNLYGLDFWTDYSNRMSITAGGQVGIGTSTPHSKLDVIAQPGDGFGIGVTGSYESGYGYSGIYSHGANTDGSSGSVGGDGGEFYGGSADTTGDAGAGIYAVGGEGASDGNNAYSAIFRNDIQISGNTVSDVSSSKIDHPSDPANKYLVHASVQSSEMMNMYSGNVTTDGAGHATIVLPAWFEAENTDFRYQLTVLGKFAQAVVKDEISKGRFTIMTNVPGVKVSWQVTAVRQDAYAKAHPLVAEQNKPVREIGFYQHPELYGQPATKQTEWALNPQRMRRLEAQRASAATRRPNVATIAASTPLPTKSGTPQTALQSAPDSLPIR